MPVWSQWVTFILAVLVAVLTLGGAWQAWRKHCKPIRLGLSIHPHKAAGYKPEYRKTAYPNEMLQLDITNASKHPLTLESVRMRMADGSQRPAFDEDLGEQWATEKPLAPGESTRVACSDTLEHTLDTMQALIVRTTDGHEARLGRKAITKAQNALSAARQ